MARGSYANLLDCPAPRQSEGQSLAGPTGRWVCLIAAVVSVTWAGCGGREYPTVAAKANDSFSARAERVTITPPAAPEKTAQALPTTKTPDEDSSQSHSGGIPGVTDGSENEPDSGEQEPAKPPAPDLNDETQTLTPEQAQAALEEMGARFRRDDKSVITHVYLNRTGVNDKALRAISFIPTVEVINLTSSSVSDEGLKYLKSLKSLKRVYTHDTRLSADALNLLKADHPDVQIYK